MPALPFCHISLKGQKPLPKAYPQELKTLGDHLRKRRLDLKLLQRQVALVLGVDEATIWNWENNRSSPKLRCIPTIIKFLGYVPLNTRAKTFGEKIVNYRCLSGITQKEMANRLGVDPSTLGRWERDKSKPFTINLERVATFLTSAKLRAEQEKKPDPG
jgi:transcriptional regulator with XRE-family HTH domain